MQSVLPLMYVLVVCKFEEDPLKTEGAIVSTICFSSAQGQETGKANDKMNGLIRPKLDRAFMPVLVSSNFDDDSIKNERASMETPFSHYMSIIFRRSRTATP